MLHLAEGYNTYAAFRHLRVGKTSEHLGDNSLCLGAVAACPALVVGAFYLHKTDFALAVINRRECEQPSVVVLLVAERDERLVFRAVMPREIMPRHRKSDAVVKDTIHVVNIRLVFIHLLSCKETRRRHLLRVTHTDECLAACYCSYCLARRHL